MHVKPCLLRLGGEILPPMIYKIIFTIFFVSIFTSCAGLESSYRPNADFTGGYGDDKIKNNIFVVYFDGNGFTPYSLSKKHLLRRISTVTLQQGFYCFKILDERQTLGKNFATQNTEALNTSYYYKDQNQLLDSDRNKPDENSVSSLVQLFSAGESTDCVNAKITLDTVKTDTE